MLNKINHSFKSWVTLNRYSVFLSLLTACMFVVIELKHPYFFLGPDNLHQNLPYYVHNFRSLLSGEFPLFNFHQYLGTPVLSCIQSAAFYVPNYAAVFFSKLIFGDYYSTIELLAAFHLILASLGFFKLMRHFGLENLSCCFGAIGWTFCCFVVVNGSATIMMVGYAAYLPLLLYYSLRQIDNINAIDFIFLVLVRVIIIFIGYPPYIIYILTFEFITIGLLYVFAKPENEIKQKEVSSKNIFYYTSYFSYLFMQIGSYICVLILSAPLLIPALKQISLSADRNAPLKWSQYSEISYDINDWLHGLLVPIPSQLDVYTGFGLRFISHVGWVTILIVILYVFFILRHINENRTVLVFIFLTIFSLLWANNTFITEIFYNIPLYNRQRWPFKLAYFTSFFLVVISSFGFDSFARYLMNFKYYRKALSTVIPPLILAIHASSFIFIYLTSPPLSLEIRRASLPIFKESLTDVMRSGRIISIVSSNSAEELLAKYGENFDNTLLLGFNYSTLLDLFHFAGYEVLISDNNLKHSLMLNNSAYLYIDDVFAPVNQDLAYFRTWGVKWYVVAKDVPIATPNLLRVFYSDKYRTVLYDADAKPFVSWMDSSSEQGINYRFTTNSIIIATQREGSNPLVVNVLYNPFFQATIDGLKVDLRESEDNQIIVTAPPGRQEIKITFVDPYFYLGMYISCGFLTLIFAWWLVRRLWMLRQPQVTARAKIV